MKRRVVILLIALLVAAAGQVALVWRGARADHMSIATAPQPRPARGASGALPEWSTAAGPAWLVRVFEEDSMRRRIGLAVPERSVPARASDTLADLPAWSIFHTPPGESDLGPARRELIETSYGWPLPSMRSLVRVDQRIGGASGANRATPSVTVLQGLEYTISGPGGPAAAVPGGATRLPVPGASTPLPPVLPTGILWPGFLTNTSVLLPFAWALVAGMALSASWVRRTRRHARWRRRECPRCRYHLHDDTSGCPECGWGRNDPAELERYASWGRTKRGEKHRRPPRPGRGNRSVVARGALLLAAAGLLGAMTTVVLAWWCAAFFDPDPSHGTRSSDRAVAHEDGVATIAHRTSNFGLQKFAMSVQRSESANTTTRTPEEVVPPWGLLFGPLPAPEDLTGERPRLISRTILACGWPFYSFCAAYERRYEDGMYSYVPTAGAIPLGLEPWDHSWSEFSRSLPYRPIPRGLALNLLIFSGAWVVALLGMRTARRQWRRWLRYCPECRNDLRGRPRLACDECGWRRKNSSAENRAA